MSILSSKPLETLRNRGKLIQACRWLEVEEENRGFGALHDWAAPPRKSHRLRHNEKHIDLGLSQALACLFRCLCRIDQAARNNCAPCFQALFDRVQIARQVLIQAGELGQ